MLAQGFELKLCELDLVGNEARVEAGGSASVVTFFVSRAWSAMLLHSFHRAMWLWRIGEQCKAAFDNERIKSRLSPHQI